MLMTFTSIKMKLIQNSIKVVIQISLLAVIVFGQPNPESEVFPLTLGKTIERNLKGGEAHYYKLSIQAKQFLKVIVEQKGIDVVVALYDPENRKISEVDSPNGTQGEEPLSVIAEQIGSYRLEVISPDKNAPVGSYGIKLIEQRAATDADKIMISAQKAFSEAIGLYSAGTAQSLQAAIPKFEQSRQLYQQLGDKKKEAESLGWSANIYSILGNKRKALEIYEQALPLFRAAGDKSNEANTLNNMGGTFNELGENQKSLEYFNKALPIFRAIEDKLGEAKTLTNSGLILHLTGETQKAVEFFNQAIPLFRAVNNTRGEAVVYSNLALAYSFLGEVEKALDSYNKALPLLRAYGDKSHEAIILSNLGKIYSDRNENQKALEHQKQALELFRAIGNKRGEATALTGVGFALSNLGDKQKALEYYNQSLALMRSMSDRNAEATILSNIAATYEELGEKQKALEYYMHVLPLFRFADNRRAEAIVLDYLFSHFETNNPRFAVFFGKLSVNNYQILRSNVRGLDKNIQQNFLKSVEITYRRLANSLIKQNRLAEAQQILNLFKDQQYFDFNLNTMQPPVLTGREKTSAEDFGRNLEAIVGSLRRLADYKRAIANRQPTAEQNTQLQNLEAQQKTALDEFLAILKRAEMEFAAKPDEKYKVDEVPDLKQLQAALADLNKQTRQQTAAVYQVVGEDNFSALIITPDSIEKAEVPFKGDQLNKKALELWALMQSDEYDTTKISKEIYDVVFKPLEAKLPKDTTTIMWSLDGNLRYIPMAALYDGKRFLAERYRHAVFTRTDSERMTRKVSVKWTGTGFGSSEPLTVNVLGSDISFSALPGVKVELSEIFKSGNGGIIKGETFIDQHFTENNFINELKQQRPLVHIASHFNFRPGDETRSFLLMGDGKAFTLEEMKREEKLFQGVELLTLSACNTAAQQPGANGREIDGFAELAQRLGAGAVMATLWQVSDASTPWLMRDFYLTRESKSGITKTEALQKAQLGLLNGRAQIKPLPNVVKSRAMNEVKIEIVPDGTKKERKPAERRGEVIYLEKSNAPLYKKYKNKPFAHPYYWSPFVLYGNWR